MQNYTAAALVGADKSAVIVKDNKISAETTDCNTPGFFGNYPGKPIKIIP